MSHAAGARADYVQGGGGNTSVKLDGGLMAIKASGYRLGDIELNRAYAVLDLSELLAVLLRRRSGRISRRRAGRLGARKGGGSAGGTAWRPCGPSVEAGFHSLLDRFVLHTHSVYANLAACAPDGREVVAAALEGAGYSWGFVPYADPGARLTFSIRDELRRVERETGRRPAVIFMQNHGLIVHAGEADGLPRHPCRRQPPRGAGVRRRGRRLSQCHIDRRGRAVRGAASAFAGGVRVRRDDRGNADRRAAVSRPARVPLRRGAARRRAGAGHVRGRSGIGPAGARDAARQGAGRGRDDRLRRPTSASRSQSRAGRPWAWTPPRARSSPTGRAKSTESRSQEGKPALRDLATRQKAQTVRPQTAVLRLSEGPKSEATNRSLSLSEGPKESARGPQPSRKKKIEPDGVYVGPRVLIFASGSIPNSV